MDGIRGIEKLPRGMFLLIHDEIMGPEIKSSYFVKPITLTREFISKLYISHAGFGSSSHIEIKFENFKSISCFTGNLDRKSQKEGILGIILEEDEEYDNLELFLQRNLFKAIENPKNEILQEIFSQKLLNYLELNQLFQKVEIEGIPEIFLITGNDEYKSSPLKISENNISISKMTAFYKSIIKNQKIPQYKYIELNIKDINNTYLVLKMDSSIKNIESIIKAIKPYLEKYFYYSVEILALTLLASVIRIIPLKKDFSKKEKGKSTTLLQSLQQFNNYYIEFNNIISEIINGDIYITPSL